MRALEQAGVDTIFGIPGGAILPAYDPLFDSEQIRHILVRHEQGAGHAAQGYAMVTGRVGVCMATSGPGATNLVTAIADAHMAPRAEKLLNRLRIIIASLDWNDITPGSALTFSAGVTQIRPADTPEEMIERADIALYDSKQWGRNCVKVAA